MTFMVVMAVCDCNGHSGDNYDIFGDVSMIILKKNNMIN